MSEKENLIVNGEASVENAPVESAPVAEKEEKVTYTLEDGTQGSRSAYIRQEFKKDRSRGDIAKELKVAYYIVYSATANMFNAAHPEEGATAGSRGAMMEDPENPGKMIARAELMRKDLAANMTRSDIAKKYDVAYATVYAATKDESEGAPAHGGKVFIELEDGTKVARAEYIRQLATVGTEGKPMTKREIANLLHIDYAVVWAACKEKKAATPVVPTDVKDIPEDVVDEGSPVEDDKPVEE